MKEKSQSSLTGSDSFLFEQISGPIVGITSVAADSVTFTTPKNQPGCKLGFRLSVRDSGGSNINRGNSSAETTITVTS